MSDTEQPPAGTPHGQSPEPPAPEQPPAPQAEQAPGAQAEQPTSPVAEQAPPAQPEPAAPTEALPANPPTEALPANPPTAPHLPPADVPAAGPAPSYGTPADAPPAYGTPADAPPPFGTPPVYGTPPTGPGSPYSTPGSPYGTPGYGSPGFGTPPPSSTPEYGTPPPYGSTPPPYGSTQPPYGAPLPPYEATGYGPGAGYPGGGSSWMPVRSPEASSLRTQAIVSLIVNICAVLLCCLFSIPGAVVAGIAIGRADQDVRSARRLVAWSWGLLAANVLILVGWIALFVHLANTASTN